ncbi:ABC transporter ATP-binding protein [Aeromicrobium phragmitis]|uniref:ABC transporter ATP-binding protein n=2 Tax=Aeromicrobium phragmitis TaxID=2478914 RepID=A0A3L8PI21_9ACTN|nr:ABC transporter ATP-binding protein [Aeromicrobium phragmitis]
MENVTVSYRRRKALDDVSWSIGPGRVGLVGPNGAGKSTLIHCLVGLLRVRSGRIEFANSGASVGFVPQKPELPGQLRVRETIEYCAWLRGVPRKATGALADDVIESFALEEFATSKVRALSGGQRQRVAIAAAVAHRPEVLILDEPTAGLDPTQRLAVRRCIKELDSVDCVLIATHLVEDIEHLCSDVGVLNRGRLEFTGSVDELLARAPAADAGVHGSAFEEAYDAIVNGNS